jgi:hypothetical protein
MSPQTVGDAAAQFEAGGAPINESSGRFGGEATPRHGGHRIEPWAVTAVAVGHLLTHGCDIARAFGYRRRTDLEWA